jgi:hypothetical protein
MGQPVDPATSHNNGLDHIRPGRVLCVTTASRIPPTCRGTTSVHRRVAWAAATAVAALCGACSSASPSMIPADRTSSAAPGHPSSTAATSVPTGTPKQLCRNALGRAVLLDWAPGTVAQFRTYQYGGPTAKVPLAHAFSRLPGSTSGAWCGTKEGPKSTHWWAVVPGHEPASLIILSGPGEGVVHGSVTAPPRIP